MGKKRDFYSCESERERKRERTIRMGGEFRRERRCYIAPFENGGRSCKSKHTGIFQKLEKARK